jgi:hypothetical protein
MVEAIRDLLDFSYLVRRNDFDMKTLDMVSEALAQFHQHHKVFHTTGVWHTGFRLPHQHSLCHYRHNIEEFGALNGLCSSITESRHKSAVKKPWHQSSQYEALGQMLLINQHLDKLAASRADFIERGMLRRDRPPPCEGKGDNEDEDSGPVEGERVMAHVRLARTRCMWVLKGMQNKSN